MDPRDAVKLGLRWLDGYYVDPSLCFGNVYGSTIFELLAEVIAFVLRFKFFSLFNINTNPLGHTGTITITILE